MPLTIQCPGCKKPGRRDLPVNGTLSATAQVSGTFDDPRVAASLTIANGRAYEERFDRLQGAISYTPQLIQVSSMRLDARALISAVRNRARDGEQAQVACAQGGGAAVGSVFVARCTYAQCSLEVAVAVQRSTDVCASRCPRPPPVLDGFARLALVRDGV